MADEQRGTCALRGVGWESHLEQHPEKPNCLRWQPLAPSSEPTPADWMLKAAEVINYAIDEAIRRNGGTGPGIGGTPEIAEIIRIAYVKRADSLTPKEGQ